MTKKTYTVLKTVKIDGVERQAESDVSLEPGQAEKLLGVFVEEKGAPTKGDGPASPKATKSPDGL